MSQLLVSIITTCLNAENTIEDTIRSVLGQTYNDIEYIVVDGGSTDRTVDIIKKYEEDVDYWISEKDKGISEGFNKGIKKANGELIGILNSDDWYEKDAVETMVKLHQQHNADFYLGALCYWTDRGDSFVVKPDSNFQDKIYYRMPNINHPTVFVKKEVYDEIGLFKEGFNHAMDYDLFLRAVRQEKEFFTTEKIVTNMRFGGRASRNAFKAYKEVAKIAPHKTKAYLWLVYSCFKLGLRRTLNELGLRTLLRFLRSLKYQ